MRFALLGDHADGLALAQALVDSGRHQLVAAVTAAGEEALARLGGPRRYGDVEEVLADPAVDAVLVAGAASVRTAQLRRALQSERPVACVHPADERPDGAYEAAMIQSDTRLALVPVLPEALHPAVARFAEFIDREGANSSVGAFRLLLVERHGRGEVLSDADGPRPGFPGWDVLRRLGGELAEVSAFAGGEGLEPARPVLLAGRFERGGLLQVTLVPARPAAWWRLAVLGERGQAELTFPQGWDGPAILEHRAADGEALEEYWPRWDPWPVVVEAFEAAVAGRPSPLSWQDEVRALELDDAARASAGKRRAQLMEYQEASEEVGFKGTMALAGCALLWLALLLLIASAWAPRLGWLILPVLVGFIVLQLLRYVLPPKDRPS